MPEKMDKSQATKEYGGTGAGKASGLQEEYLRELRWPKSVEKFDKMRRSDSQVQAILLAMELPIRSTNWYIKPASDDKKDEEIAEFLSENLFTGPPKGMTQHFDDLLRLALTMLPFGFSVFEKVFEVKDGKYYWKKLAHRPQRTIQEFLYDDEGGPDGIIQTKITGGGYERVDIPIEKLLVFSNRPETGDLKGQSMLRSAYKHWKIKDFLYEIVNIGVERNLVGTPTVELPEGADSNDKARAEKIARNLRSGESAGVTIPKGFLLDIFEGKRGMMEVMPYIEHHDQKLAGGVLAQFLNLGDGNSGSYALSKDQSDMFIMSLNATAKYLCDTINSHAIPQLVQLNWGEVENYPQLKNKPISKNENLIKAVNEIAQGELIIPDDNLEAWAREVLDLPEKAEDGPDREPAGGGNSSQFSMAETIKSEEHDHGDDNNCGCLITLSDRYNARTYQEGSRVWRRDLTAWEKRVNLEDLEDQWDQAEEEFMSNGQNITNKMIQDLFERMRRKAEAGKLDDLSKIPVRFRGEFTDWMANQSKDLQKFGIQNASAEIDVDPDDVPISNDKRRATNARAGVVADNIGQTVKTMMALNLLDNIDAGQTVKSASYNARKEAEKRAERELKASASAQVNKAINEGREMTAEESGVKLAQFSAILDDKVCPLCEEMDGMIIELDNPDYDRFQPPIHYHCRCVWVYIKLDETPQPEPNWVTPSSTLVAEHGSLVG